MSDVETNRLLGTLIAKIDGLEKRMDRADAYTKDRNRDRDDDLKAVLKDVEELKRYMIENKGGRRMLVLLLTASGGLGAFVTEMLQRLIHFR